MSETQASYAIMTDTGAQLPPLAVQQLNIRVVDLHYQMQGVAYAFDIRSQTDLTAFYYAMRSEVPVRTIPVLPEAFCALWEPELEAGRDVLQLTISRGMSNTMQAAMAARIILLERYGAKRRIVVVDTGSVGVAEGMLVYEAAGMREEGRTLDEAAQWVVQNRQHMNGILMPESLAWLRDGGQYTDARPLGSLFSKRQLLRLDPSGRLAALGHARDEQEGVEKIAAAVRRAGYSLNDQIVSVTHANVPELAEALAQALKDTAGCGDVCILPMGPIAGCYAGPGAVGVAFFGSTR